MERQMTVKATDASIRAYSLWKSIPWKVVENDVRRLQARSAKAVVEMAMAAAVHAKLPGLSPVC